jgi:hypothetical protein
MHEKVREYCELIDPNADLEYFSYELSLLNQKDREEPTPNASKYSPFNLKKKLSNFDFSNFMLSGANQSSSSEGSPVMRPGERHSIRPQVEHVDERVAMPVPAPMTNLDINADSNALQLADRPRRSSSYSTHSHQESVAQEAAVSHTSAVLAQANPESGASMPTEHATTNVSAGQPNGQEVPKVMEPSPQLYEAQQSLQRLRTSSCSTDGTSCILDGLDPSVELPILCTAVALFPFEAKIPEEISFAPGQYLSILSNDPDGWWLAEYIDESGTRKRGLVPSNFIKVNAK